MKGFDINTAHHVVSSLSVKEMDSQKQVNQQTITLLDHPESQKNDENYSDHFFEEIRLESPQQSEERRKMNPILARLEEFEQQE